MNALCHDDPRHEDPRIAAIVLPFEQLSPEKLPQLGQIYIAG